MEEKKKFWKKKNSGERLAKLSNLVDFMEK